MAVNSPQPTILCVLTLCVCVPCLYDQYVPFLHDIYLYVAIVIAVKVVGNHVLGMNWSVVFPQGTIICLPARGVCVGGVSVFRLSPLIRRCRRHAHNFGESPIWKGLVFHNPYGHNYLLPSGRSGCRQSVLFRVSFVQLYSLFCCCLRRTHGCPESSLGKVGVGCNAFVHYHLRPSGRSRRFLYILLFLFYCCHTLIHSLQGVI